MYKILDRSANATKVDGASSFTVEEILIQSPHILEAIKDLPTIANINEVKGYPTEIRAPSAVLYFNFDRIREIFESHEKSSDQHRHLGILVEVMTELFSETAIQIHTLLEE